MEPCIKLGITNFHTDVEKIRLSSHFHFASICILKTAIRLRPKTLPRDLNKPPEILTNVFDTCNVGPIFCELNVVIEKQSQREGHGELKYFCNFPCHGIFVKNDRCTKE